MNVLGLDIGGASLKASDGRGYAVRRPLALWKHPDRLADELRSLLRAAPTFENSPRSRKEREEGNPSTTRLAATMTGELADCFATRTEGVLAILDALGKVAPAGTVSVYRLDGRLVPLGEAAANPLACAASNWLALATFAARFATHRAALLLDIGSTTCDVVPIVGGRPAHRGTCDTERMIHGELVYTGVQRSSVCAVVRGVPYRGHVAPVAHEHFATMQDVYLTLGDLPQEPESNDTANGRPATRAAARDRLARVICTDRDSFDSDDARAAARACAAAQHRTIADAAKRVAGQMADVPRCAIVSGAGEFLARRVAASIDSIAEVISLAERIGPAASICAPAHALAVLLAESSPAEARNSVAHANTRSKRIQK